MASLKHLNEQHTDSPIPTPAITEELLQELRRLLEAATPARWETKKNRHANTDGSPWGWIAWGADNGTGITWKTESGRRDADLVVALRNAAPSLLAAAARLKETEARCEALRQEQILHHNHGEESCFCCAGQWTHGAAERHAPDCVARPLPESQR